MVSQRLAKDIRLLPQRQSHFIPHSNSVARVSGFVSCPQTSVPKSDVKKVYALGCITETKPKEPIIGSKHACPFPQREILSLSDQTVNKHVLFLRWKHISIFQGC